MDEQYGQLIEPAPVPFTFGAPGWYVLGVLLLLVLLLVAWLVYKYYRRNKYRSQAIRQVQSLEALFLISGKYDQLIYESNMLIKRIAMAKYNRQEVAGTRGDAWIQYLNRTAKLQLFTDADERVLTNSIYQSQYTISLDEANGFVNKVKVWVRKHKRKI